MFEGLPSLKLRLPKIELPKETYFIIDLTIHKFKISNGIIFKCPLTLKNIALEIHLLLAGSLHVGLPSTSRGNLIEATLL